MIGPLPQGARPGGGPGAAPRGGRPRFGGREIVRRSGSSPPGRRRHGRTRPARLARLRAPAKAPPRARKARANRQAPRTRSASPEAMRSLRAVASRPLPATRSVPSRSPVRGRGGSADHAPARSRRGGSRRSADLSGGARPRGRGGRPDRRRRNGRRKDLLRTHRSDRSSGQKSPRPSRAFGAGPAGGVPDEIEGRGPRGAVRSGRIDGPARGASTRLDGPLGGARASRAVSISEARAAISAPGLTAAASAICRFLWASSRRPRRSEARARWIAGSYGSMKLRP